MVRGTSLFPFCISRNKGKTIKGLEKDSAKGCRVSLETRTQTYLDDMVQSKMQKLSL